MGDQGPKEHTFVGDHVDFNGGIASRVENLSCFDGFDAHSLKLIVNFCFWQVFCELSTLHPQLTGARLCQNRIVQ
jgi:hypothetical protein